MRRIISCGSLMFLVDCIIAVVDEGRSPYEFTVKLHRPNIGLSEMSFINFFIPCYENLLLGKPMKADVPPFIMDKLGNHIYEHFGKVGIDRAILSLRGGLEHRLKKGFRHNQLNFWIRFFEHYKQYD